MQLILHLLSSQMHLAPNFGRPLCVKNAIFVGYFLNKKRSNMFATTLKQQKCLRFFFGHIIQMFV